MTEFAAKLASGFDLRWLAECEIDTLMPLFAVHAPNHPPATVEQRLNDMYTQGYRCLGIYKKEELIGMCGVWIQTKYHVGRYVSADHLFVLPRCRGNRIGRQIVEWLMEYGKSKGCIAMEIDAYVDNALGNAFWRALDFEHIGAHYQKVFVKT